MLGNSFKAETRIESEGCSRWSEEVLWSCVDVAGL